MAEVQATAKVKDEEGNVKDEVTDTVEYDFGEDLQDAIEKFGSDVVYSLFKQQGTISVQAVMRRHIANGLTGDDLQKKVDDYQLGVKQVTRKSPAEKVRELLAGKSAEEIEKILSEARAAKEEGEAA